MISKIIRLKKRIPDSFIRYIITGLTSLAVDYGSFVASYYVLNLSLKISVLIGLILGFVVNFSMNKYWTFKASKQNSRHNAKLQFILYSSLFAVNYTFTYLFIKFLERQGIPGSIGKIAATAVVTIWNYLIYKLAIFRQNVDVEVILE